MAKKSTKKTRDKRATPAETDPAQILRSETSTVKKRGTNESIEMTPRNRPTSANDEQTGRVQAFRTWFTSNFERKARELILTFC